MTSKAERPRQVTLAAWTIMIGSAFVVLLTFEMISNLHTLQTRESVEGFLSEPPGDGLGLSVDGALTIMRTLGMVAGGCAAAAGILGYQVLRRNKPARIALTVLAVPLLISGTVTGGFLSSLVAASAFLLWLPPARDWFAGREPARRAATQPASPGPWDQRGQSGPPPAWPPPTPAPQQQKPPPDGEPGPREPGPMEPGQVRPGPVEPRTGEPTTVEPRPMTGFGTPTGVAAPPATMWSPASTRPPAVVWACSLTWLFSGLGAVLMVVGMAYLAASPDALIAEMRAQNPELVEAGLTDQMIMAVAYVTGGALVLWALAAMVLAFLVYRGIAWARVLLLVSTGGAVALLALGALAQLVLMVPFLAAAMTLTLLLRPETVAWVRR